MAQSLGQVIAAEAAARSEANKRSGALHKQGQKEDLFNGHDKTYSPFAEADPGTDPRSLQQPPDTKRVQLRAEDLFRSFLDEMHSAVDLAATKDEANRHAVADVVIGDTVLLPAVPATHLLHMEKVLEDFATFVAKLPVRNPTTEWHYDPDTRLSHSPEVFTNRDEVRVKPLVVVPSTKEHLGTGTTIQERVAVGRWTNIDYTGALAEERKRFLEARIAELKVAFKQAREAANRIEAQPKQEAKILFDYILG